MIGVLVFLIFIAISFFIGFRFGRRGTGPHSEALQKARADAWGQGYNAAVAYLKDQEDAQPHAPPAAVQPTAPASGAAPTASPAAAGIPALQRTPVIQRVPTPVQPPAPPRKVLSKRERELRNINITLYVAALLIVAAGALFLNFALPPTAKIVALFCLAAAFYGGGLIVHATKKSLRPAATAFTGTGLALLPLSAIATYNTVALSGQAVWLIFSVVGTLAVGFATIRLRSRVLAWIAVLILVSTAMATAATMQRGVFYYLLLLLLLSVALMLAATQSKSVRSSLFFEATSATSQLLPLLVAALGIILLRSLTDSEVLWVSFLLTVQLLLSVKLFNNLRGYRFMAARAAAMATLLSACSVVELRDSVAALILAMALGIQGVLVVRYSRAYRRTLKIGDLSWRVERAVLWLLVVLSALSAYIVEGSTAESGWISYFAVPVLMLLTLPVLLRQAKIEAAAMLLLAFLPLGDALWEPQRTLVSLSLALLICFVLQRGAVQPLKLVYGVLCWALSLALGFFAARSIVHLGFDPIAANANTVVLAGVVGVWVPAFLWWIGEVTAGLPGADQARRPGRLAGDVHLLRIAGSAIVVLATLGMLHSQVTAGFLPDGVFGFEDTTWFIGGLLAYTLLLMASSIRFTSANAASAEENILRCAACVGLLVGFMMSFVVQFWILALIVAVLLIAHFLSDRLRVRIQWWKIVDAGIAQLVFSSAVYWFADRMQLDVHGRFALFTLSLAIPQLLRLVASWRAGNELRRELRWIATAMLLFLPLATAFYAATSLEVDRGVLLLEAALFGIYGFAAFAADRTQRISRQFYLMAPALAAMAWVQIPAWRMTSDTGWVHTAWWDRPVSLSLLLLLSVLGLLAEWLQRNTGRYTYVTGVLMFLPLLMILGWNPHRGWVVAASALSAVIFSVMVHTRKVAWFALGTGAFLYFALQMWVELWRYQQFNSLERSTDTVWVLLGVAVVLGLLAATHGRFVDPAPAYPQPGYHSNHAVSEASRLYLVLTFAALFFAGLLLHLDHDTDIPVLAGALLIFGVAVALRIFESGPRVNVFTVDILLPLAALLGISSYSILVRAPEADEVLSYFSVVAVLLAAWRYYRPLGRLMHAYVVAAGVLVSLVMVLNMIDGNSITRTYALVFFAALISWGLKASSKLYIWWGALAITLAVLWTLRSMAFLWLVLLGIGLIVVAVLRLMRVDRKPGPEFEPPAPPPAPGPAPGLSEPPAGNRMPWMNGNNQGANRPDAGDDQRAH